MTYTDMRIRRKAEPPRDGNPAKFHAYIECECRGDAQYMLWFGSDSDAVRLDEMASRALNDLKAYGHVQRDAAPQNMPLKAHKR